MRRKVKKIATHRRKPASKQPSLLCWGLIFLFVSGINLAAFSLSAVDHARQTYQLEVIPRNISDGSDSYATADRQHRLKYEILPTKLPPDPDATTAEKGVLWKYRLPDGVEFSLMQMPTIHAVAAGTHYTAAHRCC